MPDVVTMSKSFGGGKASISGYTAREPIFRRAYDRLGDATLHSTTYYGFGEQTATAIEAVAIAVEDDYPGRARAIGDRLRAGLEALAVKYPTLVTDVRGSGALQGVFLAAGPELLDRALRLIPSFVRPGLSGTDQAGHRRRHRRPLPRPRRAHVLRIQPAGGPRRVTPLERFGAKQSMLVSYLPEAEQLGARVVADARVERLEHEGGVVTAVCGTGAGGRPFRYRPRVVFLAAGSIRTPLLLQRSGIRRHQAGREIAWHLNFRTVARFPEVIRADLGTIFTAQLQEFTDRGFVVMAANLSPGSLAAALGTALRPRHGVMPDGPTRARRVLRRTRPPVRLPQPLHLRRQRAAGLDRHQPAGHRHGLRPQDRSSVPVRLIRRRTRGSVSPCENTPYVPSSKRLQGLARLGIARGQALRVVGW